MLVKLRKLPGMKRSKKLYKSTQYWVRKRETDLQIGFKHNTWYGAINELGGYTRGGKDKGLRRVKKRGILRSTVMENIDEIRRIQGAYLSAIENENKALGLIDKDGNAFYGEGEE